MEAVAAAGETAVRGATLFDIYEPPQGAAGIAAGERSLAVRLELRDDERTLTDEQIERVVAAVVASLERAPRRPAAPAITDRVRRHGPSRLARPIAVLLPTLVTPTLTKAELAELLFERLGLNKRESKDMVEAFFDLIYATLLSGRRRQDVGLRQLQHPAQGAPARAATRAPARRSRSRPATS